MPHSKTPPASSPSMPADDESVAGEEDPGASLDQPAGTGEGLCRDCGGSGRLGDMPCPACGGSGKVTVGLGGI